MANFPVIWQFLTVVDRISLAFTPGRNAEHCYYIPNVVLASSYLKQKLSFFFFLLIFFGERIPDMRSPAERLLGCLQL